MMALARFPFRHRLICGTEARTQTRPATTDLGGGRGGGTSKCVRHGVGLWSGEYRYRVVGSRGFQPLGINTGPTVVEGVL